MATISGYGQFVQGGVHEHVWASVTSGDVGSWLDAAQLPDKTVEVSGDFGTGSTLVIEGSNDGAGYHTIQDKEGNALSFTANGLQTILENPKYLRPHCTAGDDDTDLTVRLISRRDH